MFGIWDVGGVGRGTRVRSNLPTRCKPHVFLIKDGLAGLLILKTYQHNAFSFENNVTGMGALGVQFD